jgi:predicted AlkP superfamily pyrophosphatase or phosphodiesterase
MRSLIAFVAGAAVLAVGGPAHAAPSAPRLVIAISVDQFSSAVYRRYASSFTGGLKQLSSGIAYPVGYQSHAATETCPGHSTILTGDHPARTGIVANNWFDRTTGKYIYCAGEAGERGPQLLRVTTLGDWMRAAYPGARVVSVSGKDRAAIMLAGHYPNLVGWWESGVGFTTSKAAEMNSDGAKAWLDAWNAQLKARWRQQRPQLWTTEVSERCRKLVAPLKVGPITLSGQVPPRQSLGVADGPDFFDRAEFHSELKSSPLYDKLVLDLAGDLAESYRLGSGTAPDLLTISLSATDYVGHRFGPGGAAMCENMRALDRSLATFFERIDAMHVPYVVVLTADHGSVDAAERIGAERLDSHAFMAALNQHLRQTLAIDQDVIEGDPKELYIKNSGDAALRERILDETLAWLRDQPQVVEVFTAAQVAASAPREGEPASKLTTAERFYESFDPQRSGDLFVEIRERESFGIPDSVGDSIAGHGSPWDYDRQVPILFWWSGAPAETHSGPAETVDIAPTLAAILGISPPAVDGECLKAVAACPDGLPY